MASDQLSGNLSLDEPIRKAHLTDQAPSGWRSGSLAGTLWALAAGLAAWVVIHNVYPVFATTEGADQWGFLPLDVQWRLDRNNSMFVLGLLGGLTSLALSTGEGIARRSWRVVLLGGAACAAAGLLAGCLAGYVGHRAFEQYRANAEISDLTKAIIVNGMMFTTLGGGVGLGVGATLGGWGTSIRGFGGGMLAGALAAALYPVIVAALMPAAMTSVLLPLQVGERLVWFGLASAFLGAFIPGVARGCGCKSAAAVTA